LVKTTERHSEARVSGDFPWSRLAVRRGADDPDESQFKLALQALSFAEDRSAPAKHRATLARVYLYHARARDSKRALEILRELAADGADTAEVYNDIGAAFMQLGKNEEAIAQLDYALNKKPDFEEALFNRALAEQSAKKFEDAKRDWNRFILTTKDEKWKLEAEAHLRDID